MYEYVKNGNIESITVLMAELNIWGDVAAIFGNMTQEERENLGVYPIEAMDPIPYTKNLQFVKEFDEVEKKVIHKYSAVDMTPAEAKAIIKKKITSAQLKALALYKDDIELANLLGEELDPAVAESVDAIKLQYNTLRSDLDVLSNIVAIREFVVGNNL